MNFDFKKFLWFLIPAMLAYFLAANVFQHWLQPRISNFDIIDAYPGYPILPEPYEISLYMLSYLAVPLLALALYWLWNYKIARRAAFAGAALAGGLVIWKITQMPWPDFSWILEYLRTRDPFHIIWLLTTKRLYLVRLAMLASLGVFVLLLLRPPHLAWLASASPALKKIAALFFILLAVLIFEPNFTYQDGFTNFILSPAFESISGKPLLYDTTSVYGIFSVYFTAFLIKFLLPVSYKSMSFIIMISYFIFYWLLYKILKMWTESRVFALLGAWLAVIAGYFLLVDPYIQPTSFIGQTAYRQGFYIIPFYFLVRYWKTRSRAALEFVFLFSALGFFWNIDNGVYINAATFLTLAYLALMEETAWLAKLKKIFLQGLKQLAYILGVFGAASLVNYAVYGAWPNWLLEIVDISTFNTGYGKIIMPKFGIFEVLMFTYMAFLYWIVRRARRRQAVDLPVVYFTVYGIFSFIYYAGNSAWSYLHFISIPALILILYFFYRYFREGLAFAPRRVMAAGLSAFLFFALFLTAAKLPVAFARRDYSNISLKTVEAKDISLYEDAQYLREHFPEMRLPVLHEHSSQILIMAGKINYFYLQDRGQRLYSLYDKHLMIYRRHAQGIVDQVNAGKPEYLFIDNKPDQIVADIERAITADYTIETSLKTLNIYRRK